MKNGGTGGGGWWEREFQEEAGEELVKVGWTRGRNGRGRLRKRSCTVGVEGRGRRARLRWEDCVKRKFVGLGRVWKCLESLTRENTH